MITKKAHNMTSLALLWLSVFVFLCEGLSSAEDRLSKEGGLLFLGWAQPGGKFLTCNNNTVAIGQGKIEQVQEKCPLDSGAVILFGSSLSPFMVTGEVEGKATATNTLKLKNEFGVTKSFYYLPASLESGAISLKDIKVGDKITITGPMQGRADTITR